MNFKPFLYFLVEEDGKVRQVVNGVVMSLNTKTPLPNTPIGWQDISILWQRNKDRWGQVRNFSLGLGFVKDGALILRNDMYKGNIDRVLYLVIKQLTIEVDLINYKIYYKHLYKGQLDFSTFKDLPGSSKVDINIMEGGLSKLIKANENTDFFIPFDEEAVNVIMDGVFLFKTANYALIPDLVIDNTNFAQSWFAPFQFINSEGSAAGVAFFSQTLENNNALSWDQKLQSINFFAEAGGVNVSDIDLVISGTIEYQCTEQDVSNNFRMRFIKSTQLIADQNDFQLFNDLAIVQDQIYTHPVSITIPLVPGERIYLEGILGSTGVDTKIKFTENSKLNIGFKYKAGTTTIKAFPPYILFKKLCAKLEITEDKIQSDLLKNSTLFVTSGDGIRGLTGSGIKTSFNKFFKAFNVYLFAGIGIEGGKVLFEDRLHFFNPAAPVPLGTVKDMTVTPATDLMYSSIKIGHEEQNIDDVNGKYDFNGFHIYTTPIKSGAGVQQDLQSPYKAGPYEIEIIRINLEGKTTTDSDNDNAVYILDCANAQEDIQVTVTFALVGNGFIVPIGIDFVAGQVIRITGSAAGNDGTYTISAVTNVVFVQFIALVEPIIADEASVSVLIEFLTGTLYELDRSVVPDSGVPDPDSIFNVRLRPSELFKKHYRWTRSYLHNYEPGIVKFESANRNKDLVVDGKVDGRDVQIGLMGEKIFLPYYLEFLTITPIDLTDTLETDINSPFLPTWDGVDYGGFMFSSGIACNSREPQTFKLLSFADNDLEELINV